MSRYRLPLILIACTTGAGSVLAWQEPRLDSSTAAYSKQPLADRPAMVNLTEIYTLLTATTEADARARLSKQTGKSSRRAASVAGSHQVAFIDARRLADDKVMEETRALFDAGIPVAVFAQPGLPAAERSQAARLFGAASGADLAIYARQVGDGVRTFSTDIGKSLHYPDKARHIQRFQQAAANHLDSLPALDRAPARSSRTSTTSNGSSAHLPIYEFTDTTYGKDNQYLTREITVVRDSTASKDEFNVIMKTSGLINGGNDLVASGGYTATYHVDAELHHLKDAKPTTLRAYPETTGVTDINFNRDESRATNYGFNMEASAEATFSLTPSATVKTSFGFNYSKNHSKSTSIAFSVQDYSTTVGASSSSGKTAHSWKFDLSEQALASFRKNGATPAMKQLAPQTYSVWTLKASEVQRSTITLVARSGVTQKGSSIRKADRVITDSLTVNLDSPYLHREPVVLLRSQADAGYCLVNRLDDKLVLGACTTVPERKVQQWYMDAAGRYVNRSDGKCLTVQPDGDEHIKLADCKSDATQEWYWSADRINSKYNGGDNGWRLFVDKAAVGESVKARIDVEKQQVIPNNVNYVLLNPWSSYPDAPTSDDTIPVLQGGIATKVPGTWATTYNSVSSGDRWEPEPLRQNWGT
ncbi:RICIN domain-containing protein [Dyella marensis]|uniref:RICIN domain-containing protein n=1 Tax=Dyella marensis TaxID=500610 RepID=UPI0031D1D454